MPDDAPSIYDYLDYRQFLADWFVHEKSLRPTFSHRAFVRRTGQRSPSLLSDVIAGRRNLTPAGLEGFLRALRLPAPEARFFTSLVELDQAETPDEKNAAWADVAATQRFRSSRRLEDDGFRYLSTWYVPVVRELANRDDFREDPAWIARQIRPRITAAQARDALELLIEMDLLRREPSGRIGFGGGSVVTPHEVRSLAVRNYHDGMLERAREALTEVDRAQRHFLGVTVSVPEALLPELKERLNAVQERVLDLCSSSELPGGRVMQFTFSFFPLSTAEEEGS
jgi:uncharacterized protein (TIGR02147 family)